MASESQIIERVSGVKVVMVFTMPEDDARKIYLAADVLGMSISGLLRSIIYDRTNGLRIFDPLPDPTPGPDSNPGRPIKRFVK